MFQFSHLLPSDVVVEIDVDAIITPSICQPTTVAKPKPDTGIDGKTLPSAFVVFRVSETGPDIIMIYIITMLSKTENKNF